MSNDDIKNDPSNQTIDDHKKTAYLSVDIGTTNLKCSLYNHDLISISSYCIKVKDLF